MAAKVEDRSGEESYHEGTKSTKRRVVIAKERSDCGNPPRSIHHSQFGVRHSLMVCNHQSAIRSPAGGRSGGNGWLTLVDSPANSLDRGRVYASICLMLRIHQVAALAGVHKDTLLRWLRAGVVAEPRRDMRGWRTFSEREAKAIVVLAKRSTKPAESADGAKTPIAGRLGSINWDFRDAKTDYLTHGIHPYPAKFIPQIPNALVQELSGFGDTVADVFCGSGTTLVEALLLRRHAIGVDAGPLACLISRAKTARLAPDELDELRGLSARARALAAALTTRGVGLFKSAGPFVSTAPRPADPKLAFWFQSQVTEELAELLLMCRAVRSDNGRDLALVSFSSIVVAVSNQDSDTRYVRRAKSIPEGETFRRFARALDAAISAAEKLCAQCDPGYACRVICADVLDAPDLGVVDMVVTSPPYPNAYSYHLYHRTRMLWLGMDGKLFKAREIGSHRKYSSTGPKAATVETFRSEMRAVFRWLHDTIRPGGFACFVVGDSTIRGRRVDNTALLTAVARESGFKRTGTYTRLIRADRKAFNPAIGSIRQERVLVLRNG